MIMAYQQILADIIDGTLQVTINRSEKMNALNREVLADLANAISFASNSPEVRAVLITGAGEKAFVAGADIAEFKDYGLSEGKELAKKGHESVFNAIENCSKPVIAAINGFALGGGLELAMACHIRIASENAKLGLPEVTLGLIPGYGGTQRLTQLVGKGRALEMITTADMITAEKAMQIGLVNHVVPQNELIAAATAILAKIKERAPLAVASAIKAVNASLKGDTDGFAVEIDEFAKCFETSDFKEGVHAFFEKRKPNFNGE